MPYNPEKIYKANQDEVLTAEERMQRLIDEHSASNGQAIDVESLDVTVKHYKRKKKLGGKRN